MTKTKANLVLAGVFVGCALIAWRLAWATPGMGISSVNLIGPSTFSASTIKSETEAHEVEIKTKGFSDIWVVHNTIIPGGHTGWHSHPGPSIISVKSGIATEYHSDHPNTPHVHFAGSSFVDDGKGAHIIRNEGATNLELVAFQILPSGAQRRIDQPQP